MANGMIKSKGMKTSFYSMARERMGDLAKGMLNNPSFKENRVRLAKVQKKLSNFSK